MTHKGFVYMVLMQSKKNIADAVKQFAKVVGTPDARVADAAAEHKSQYLKRFLRSIGTQLRILEEDTPWFNKAELFIGLIKEACWKDMRFLKCILC